MHNEYRTEGLKVFIVDDSQLIIDRVLLAIGDLNNVSAVGYAQNITSTLLATKRLQPDVVLLDIHLKEDLPHANGMDLLISLRKDYPNMVIMMLSNMASTEYIKKCMSLGADYFFDKSSDFERVFEVLQKIQDNIKENCLRK